MLHNMICGTDSYDCDAFTAPTCPIDDYVRALQSVFPARLALNELPGHGNVTKATPICSYGKGPLFVHSEESVNVLVPFLANWLKDHEYDGVCT